MSGEDKNFNSYSGNFPDNLKVVSYCPICNSRHNPMAAKVIEERSEYNLIYIKCRNCQSAVLAVVSFNNFGLASVGLVTDLQDNEVIKFRSASTVSCDDVINLHKLLAADKVLIDQLN